MSIIAGGDTKGNYSDFDTVYSSVQQYYGAVLQSTKDLKTSACTAASRPHPLIQQLIRKVPEEINSKFYGCGNPIPLGIEGLHVLDLGSGSGRDCYVAAQLVGPNGSVTGIDMTDEQLQVSREHIENFMKVCQYPKANMRFVQGYIEFLEKAGIEPNSMDLVISNCVVNLSPNKQRVLDSVYQVLKEGGEFYFSDVYCDRRLSEKVRSHEVLLGECIAGALYIGDFERLCRETGFFDPRVASTSEIKITDPELKDIVGEAKFYSITYRLFKLKNLEPQCEDYGQYAIYKGTIEGHKHSYELDDHHKLETGKPFLVCGNTASMLSETWLSKYFDVIGTRDVHYGVFPCGPTVTTSSSSGGSSCDSGLSCKPPTGSCC